MSKIDLGDAPGAQEERRTRGNVLPVLLGSSALLVQKGLTESLSGRFFLHRCPGYPGAAPLAKQESGGRPAKMSGIEAFRKRYPKAKVWLIGGGGIKLEDFFNRPAVEWFK